jgi:hypothetical protein
MQNFRPFNKSFGVLKSEVDVLQRRDGPIVKLLDPVPSQIPGWQAAPPVTARDRVSALTHDPRDMHEIPAGTTAGRDLEVPRVGVRGLDPCWVP